MMPIPRSLCPRHAVSRPAWLAAALLVALAGCGTPEETTQPAETPAAADRVTLGDEAAKTAGIEWAPARAQSRTARITAPGTVQLNERRTARIGTVTDGIVIDVAVQPGDRVAKGARLATVLSHVFHDAWAEYFKALAERRTAEREVAYARSAAARADRLVADKALSRQEADRAAADLVHAEQTLAAARAVVTRAEQDLEHYGLTPREDANPAEEDRMTVTAPFDGVVIERLVSPGTAVTPGTPLMVLSDLATVWVTAEVDEAHLAELAPGRDAAIQAAAYPGESFAAAIDAVGDLINPATRRVTVRLVAPNRARRLKPQMFVTVQLGVAAEQRVIVVPADAVQRMDGAPVVFVRGEGGVYERRAVTTGAEVDGQVEIRAGLADGELVVVKGAFLVKSAIEGGGEGA